MTTGSAEEISFPDTKDNLEEKIVSLGKWTFTFGGLIHDFKDAIKRLQESMKHWTDRGPRDYDTADKESLRELVRSTVRATVEIQGGYQEGGNGSSPQWRNWVMTMLGTLIVIGITGLIVMYANQKAMSERMDGFERRISNIEHKLWP